MKHLIIYESYNKDLYQDIEIKKSLREKEDIAWKWWKALDTATAYKYWHKYFPDEHIVDITINKVVLMWNEFNYDNK